MTRDFSHAEGDLMELQIWSDQLAARALGIEVSSIGFWLTSDTTKELPSSFSLVINARVLGVQVGSVTIDPLKNGPFTMPLVEAAGGTVEGKIDDWGAFDKAGNPVASSDTNWKTADSVAFLITGIADVTIPASAITTLIPGLGWLAKAALGVLGNKVKISVAHQHVAAHLPHGSP
jgi:hypothetical protein